MRSARQERRSTTPKPAFLRSRSSAIQPSSGLNYPPGAACANKQDIGEVLMASVAQGTRIRFRGPFSSVIACAAVIIYSRTSTTPRQ